jgi:formylglycine-generating enzyme required for sulfatase activity
MDLPRSTAALEGHAVCHALNGMMWIPGGTFRMHRSQDGTSVRAFVSGFWMDRQPVSHRQFSEFVAATGYDEGSATRDRSLDDCPVVHVTCQDAEAYASWAQKALPTGAEWEFAAQGAYGLCGMLNGIWEWTADWYFPGSDYQSHCAGERSVKVSAEDSLALFVPRKLTKRRVGQLSGTRAQPIEAPAAYLGFRCVTSGRRMPRGFA